MPAAADVPHGIERVQTGFRMEKRTLKVLKAIAEFHDLPLGELVEVIISHAFEGESAFGPAGQERIKDIKRLYGLKPSSRRLIDPM